MAQEPYRYFPLPTPTHLRRCTIQPGQNDEPVVVSIEVVPFSSDDTIMETPVYEALSYTWGTEENLLTIFVSCDDGNRRVLTVTRNLHEALLYLRRGEESRVMWIDAICINQKDNVEKGPQVAMMGAIFRRAWRVLAWLGPEADDSNRAMALLKFWSDRVNFDMSTYRVSRVPAESEVPRESEEDDEHFRTTLANTKEAILLTPDEFRALTGLMRRPWLRRLWIRQEIHFGGHNALVCGAIELSWEAFKTGLIFIYLKPQDLDAAFWGSPESKLLRYNHEALHNLHGLLFQGSAILLDDLKHRFESASCKDPRDRLYAIVHMLDDRDRDLLKINVDYSRSYQEIYEDAVVRWIEGRESLDILCQCDPTESNRGMPSWVPDWSHPSPTARIMLASASSSLKPIWSRKLTATGDVLRAAGVTTAVVGLLGPKGCGPRSGLLPEDAIDALRTAISVDSSTSLCPELYARTLIGRVNNEHVSIQGGIDFVRRALLKSPSPKNSRISMSYDEGSGMNQMIMNLVGRRVGLSTPDGRPILCPEQAEPGDQVAIIMGCWSPMLLRPLPSGLFVIVGPCYSIDTFDGSALLGTLPHGSHVDVSSAGCPLFRNSSTGEECLFDPRLEVEGLGFDVNSAKRAAQRDPENAHYVHVEFEPMRDLVFIRTGRELRWLDLV